MGRRDNRLVWTDLLDKRWGVGGVSLDTHTEFPDSQLEGEETNCLFVQQLPNKVERV